MIGIRFLLFANLMPIMGWRHVRFTRFAVPGCARWLCHKQQSWSDCLFLNWPTARIWVGEIEKPDLSIQRNPIICPASSEQHLDEVGSHAMMRTHRRAITASVQKSDKVVFLLRRHCNVLRP